MGLSLRMIITLKYRSREDQNSSVLAGNKQAFTFKLPIIFIFKNAVVVFVMNIENKFLVLSLDLAS